MRTWKRFLAGMCPHMPPHIAALMKSFTTEITFEWTLSSMQSNMLFISTRLSKPFPTDLTLVWFSSIMLSLMLSK